MISPTAILEVRSMDPKESVQVYTVSNPLEADMICNMLKAEGIAAMSPGDYQAGYSGVGAIEIPIMVHAEDADRARRILERHDQHGSKKPHPPESKRD